MGSGIRVFLGSALALGMTAVAASPALAVDDDFAGGVFGNDYVFRAGLVVGSDTQLGINGTSSEFPGSPNFNATATGGFLTLDGIAFPSTPSGVLNITATPGAGTVPAISPLVFTDTVVEALVNVNSPGSDSDVGLFLRSDGLNGYLLALDLQDGTLDIAEVTAGAPATPDSIVFGPGFNAAEDYFLEFSAQGTTLTGRLFDEEGGTLLRSLTVSDPTRAAGFAGVFAAVNNDGTTLRALGTFDNLVIAVPEPAALGGLALGATLLAARRRRGSN